MIKSHIDDILIIVQNHTKLEIDMRENGKTIYKLTTVSVSVSILVLCSWISIPLTVGITLQLLAVFLISAIFPLTVSLTAIVGYLLLGIVGVPVFASFNTGISAIVGPSGGFLLALLAVPLIISPVRRRYNDGKLLFLVMMTVSLIVVYTVGSVWYGVVYLNGSGTLLEVLSVCVLPFVIPDFIKMILASLIYRRINPYIQKLPVKEDRYEQ